MLKLNSNLKIIKDYYLSLDEYAKHGIKNETTVRAAFQSILEYCSKKQKLTFIAEYKPFSKKNISVDGAFLDEFSVPFGYWEAKDSKDDLLKEILLKFQKGYPKDNIIFQQPERVILYQNAIQQLDEDITNPNILAQALEYLFNFAPPEKLEWETAVKEFKNKIPEIADKVINLIDTERNLNKNFVKAFNNFSQICRDSINPNLADVAIEEMLVQHLLTQRIFNSVFFQSDFIQRNIIGHEITKVITALTSRTFSTQQFLQPLDKFYKALEQRAYSITDFSTKQTFLNNVYEKFFQGFAVKVADTHGIVYTPQPIVDFIVNSIEEILQREFGKSLGSPSVHIIDPFVGTGNFILNVMRRIKKTDLQYKYRNELHCNELMLLPYYVASMNIEHEYFELMGQYEPFQGICLVDTFELAEDKQYNMFTEENTERIRKLKETPLFVILGNPPYNSGQVNENDNNKNRKYPVIDKRVSETYAKDSKATLLRKLQDPYVKAIRWASDKINENGEGIVAFVSNNSFIEDTSFDGMRKHLENDFDRIYIFNLKGNVRQNPKISGTTHNVFGIQVGVSINILMKTKIPTEKSIKYIEVDDFLRKENRYTILNNNKNVFNVQWQEITPDKNNIWLTEGLDNDFDTLLPMGTKEAKAGNDNAIFNIYSLGISTNRDTWTINYNINELSNNIKNSIEFFNLHLLKLKLKNSNLKIDDFVEYDNKKISWSRDLKLKVQRNKIAEFAAEKIRKILYRPFINSFVYFDSIMVDRLSPFPKIFPTHETEKDNLVICLSAVGNTKPFHCLIVNVIPDLHLTGDSQCFPFYTYNEDGTGRKENISDWGLKQFQEHYKDTPLNPLSRGEITKWDIFYYIYAVLHSESYRSNYAANLKRSLPHIPFYDDFWKYSEAGSKLAELHVNYEQQPIYPLEKIENPKADFDLKVQKMYLSKDKKSIKYNDFLTLSGIPYEVFGYKLGNRSALDWIIDQYQIITDKRSGITNDPNRQDEPDYIINLIGKIITVSLETVKIVNSL